MSFLKKSGLEVVKEIKVEKIYLLLTQEPERYCFAVKKP